MRGADPLLTLGHLGQEISLENTDYNISPRDANELKGISCLPVEFRVKLLQYYRDVNGEAALLSLFAEFIGLANSVVDNNREMVELFLITEADIHPETARKINLPTIFGALQGVEIAVNPKTRGMCSGCAYRSGTPANQSPITTIDAKDCAFGEIVFQFNCHMRPDPEEISKATACKGYRAAQKRRLVEAAEAKR